MSYYAWEEFCLLLEVGTKAFDENMETNNIISCSDDILRKRKNKQSDATHTWLLGITIMIAITKTNEGYHLCQQ